MEEHWRRVFSWRGDIDHQKAEVESRPENFKNTRNCVFLDVFQLAKKSDKELCFVCTIPEQRVFWEVIMTFYTLYLPELFPTGAHVARRLLGFFPRFKVHPDGVANLHPLHLQFLMDVATGVKTLVFMEYPLEVSVGLYAVMWASTKFRDQNEEFSIKLLDQLSEKKMEEQEFKDLELEWLELQEEEEEEKKEEEEPMTEDEKEEEEKIEQVTEDFIRKIQEWEEKKQIKE